MGIWTFVELRRTIESRSEAVRAALATSDLTSHSGSQATRLRQPTAQATAPAVFINLG